MYGDPLLPHVPTGYTDANGNTWSFAHNAYGQTTRITPPPNSPTQPSSLLYNETPLSPTLGYPLQATDGNGSKVTFDGYDALGDLLQASYYITTFNPHTQQNELTPFSTQFAYDAAQRLTRVTHPDGTTSQNVYAGRFLDHTLDEAGTQVNYSYCSICDALLGMNGPLGWALNWTLDGDHQIKTFKDANGHSTLYSYGAAGELTGVTLPDNTTSSLLYNNTGLVRQITNGRGRQIVPSYDAGERLQQVTFPTSGQAPLTYGYNIDDTIHTVTSGVGTTTLSYYPNGWVQSVVYDYTASGLSALQELDYTYNPDGSRSTLTWKSGATVVGAWTYSYDPGGRLTSVTNGWNEQTGWVYDEANNIINQTYSSGLNGGSVNLNIAYNNARGWPNQISYSQFVNFQTRTIAAFSLQYDNGANTVGNLTGVTEGIPFTGTPGKNGQTAAVTYGYDALYRLVSDNRTGPTRFAHTYGYDLAGNVQTINGNSFATYDAGNKISSLIGGTIAHDGDGNVTSVSSPTVPAGTFTWDDRGLLLSASNGTQNVTYGYNAGGFRVRSQVGTNAPTFYVYDGSTLLGEVQGTSSSVSTPKAVYTWGARGLISERLLSTNQSLWYVFGPQGETRLLLGPTGAVADSYTYSPYGVLLASTGTDANPFRYGGQAGYYTDTNNLTGAILCGLRWYDPALRRWLSRDPIGYSGGPNLYEYCGSNPIMSLDPTGLETTVSALIKGGYEANVHIRFDGAANEAVVQMLIADVENRWNHDPANGNKPFTVDGEPIHFRITAVISNADKRGYDHITLISTNGMKGPFTNTSNCVGPFREPKDPVFGTSSPHSHYAGEWYFYRNNTVPAAPHEFGHLLGFDDQWDRKGFPVTPFPGHENDIMGNPKAAVQESQIQAWWKWSFGN